METRVESCQHEKEEYSVHQVRICTGCTMIGEELADNQARGVQVHSSGA